MRFSATCLSLQKTWPRAPPPRAAGLVVPRRSSALSSPHPQTVSESQPWKRAGAVAVATFMLLSSNMKQHTQQFAIFTMPPHMFINSVLLLIGSHPDTTTAQPLLSSVLNPFPTSTSPSIGWHSLRARSPLGSAPHLQHGQARRVDGQVPGL